MVFSVEFHTDGFASYEGYPIVNNHNIPLGSTSVIFSGVLHVKEGDSITITTDDPDGTTVDVTVTVTYEVLS